MTRHRTLTWWYWLFTLGALAAGLAGWAEGLAMAIALTVLQAVHFAWRARSATAFPVQVRVAYLGLLLLGAWAPLEPLHLLLLAGTATLLAVDYCPLARILSLLPWNRKGPLTLARLRAAFLSPPVHGSIAAALDACPERLPPVSVMASVRGRDLHSGGTEHRLHDAATDAHVRFSSERKSVDQSGSERARVRRATGGTGSSES